MGLTKKEESELKILIGLEFYSAFEGFLTLPKEEALAALENDIGFWDLIESLKKRRFRDMNNTETQRLDAIILQFANDESRLDQMIEDKAEYNRMRQAAELICSGFNQRDTPMSEMEIKKLYLLLTKSDKELMERVAKTIEEKWKD